VVEEKDWRKVDTYESEGGMFKSDGIRAGWVHITDYVSACGEIELLRKTATKKAYQDIVRRKDKKIQELQDEIKNLEDYIKVLEEAV
jgi:hypothetical protein